MGDAGGAILGFAGAIVSYFCPPLGIAMMIAGGIWSQQIAQRKMQEAMDAAARSRAGMKTNARTSQMSIPVPYGKVRVGGNIVYMNTGGGISGGQQVNTWLFTIIGLGEGPIESVEEVWMADQMVWQNEAGLVYISEGYTGKGPQSDRFFLDWRLGCNSQDIFHQVNYLSPGGGYDILGNWAVPADMEYNDRMPMTALLFAGLNNWTNEGKDASVWNGVPQITATVKGKRCRKLSDLNVIEWTDNGPTVLFDLMTNQIYGWGLPSSKIDIASFIDAAAFCAASGTVLVNTTTEVFTGGGINKPYGYTAVDTVSPGGGAVMNFNPSSWWIGTETMSAIRYPWLANSVGFATQVGTESWSYVASGGGIYRVSGISTPVVPVLCGSFDSATGLVSIQCSGEVVAGAPGNTSPRYVTARWAANWGGSYNMQNQYIANSFTIRCGSELLYEVSSSIMISNSGGWAKVDYTRGIVDFALFSVQSNVPIEAVYQRKSHTGYSFNGYVMDTRAAIDVIREVCAHFRGYLVYSQGVYRLQIDRPGSAVYSFDEDNIKAGTFQVNMLPLSDKPNRVRVKFTDAANFYTPADVVYEVQSPVLPVSQVVIESVLEMPYLTYREEAMRMAKTHAAQSQLGLNVEFEAGFDGMGVEPGDLVNVTHSAPGWTDKTFRVLSTEETSEESIKVAAQEYDAAVYADEYL